MTLAAGISSQNGPSLREMVSGILSPQRFKATKVSGCGNLPEHLAQMWFCSAHLVVNRPSYLNKVEVPTYDMDGCEATPALVSNIRKQRMRVFAAWSGLVWSVWSTLGLGLSLNTTVRSPPHCEPQLIPAYAANGFFYIWSHMTDLLNLSSLCLRVRFHHRLKGIAELHRSLRNGFKTRLCIYLVSLQVTLNSSSTISGIDFSHLELSTSSLLQPPDHSAHAC